MNDIELEKISSEVVIKALKSVREKIHDPSDWESIIDEAMAKQIGILYNKGYSEDELDKIEKKSNWLLTNEL